MVQAAPAARASGPEPSPAPLEKAELNIVSSEPATTVPSAWVQSGMSTRASRGIEMTSIRRRSAETCRIIAVSERAIAVSSLPSEPSTLLEPARESEPSTRTLTALPS